MKKLILSLAFSLCFLAVHLSAQSLYVPNGLSGIGNATNSDVGVESNLFVNGSLNVNS